MASSIISNTMPFSLHLQAANPPSGSPFSIPFGIIVGLLASFVQSLGLTIQRKSHVINQALPEHRRRVEHRRPLWLLGFAIFISSNILGSLVQIAALPVVILAPLGAVSLLWNAFFARLILGDVFSPWMILGTILIAGGAVLIAVFGIVPEPTRSLEDLLVLFRRPAFAAYFSILTFVVVLCLGSTHIAEFALSRKLSQTADWEASALLTPTSNLIDLTTATDERFRDGDIPDAADENTPLLPSRKDDQPLQSPPFTPESAELKPLHRTRIFIAISYASFSGILSGMCLIFAKSGVQLLLLTLQGDNQFWRWESWVLLIGLVIFALLQLWYLHKALILADPTLVCPSAFCFYNLSSILNGLIYFDQLSLIKPLHLSLVSLGIVVLLGGVWVVSIQAGEGVVDVVAWTEESEEEICEEPLTETQHQDNGVLHEIDLTKPVVVPRIGPVPMERETLSDSNIPHLGRNVGSVLHQRIGTSPESSRVLLDQTQDSRRRNSAASDSSHHLFRHNTTGPRNPTSPPLQTRFSLRDRLSSINSELYRQNWGGGHSSIHGSGSVSQTNAHGPLSPPLNPTGFQIGLSPVSPGFAIMPMERKSRLYHGLGVGAAPSTRRRRTVSEGDIITRNSRAEPLPDGGEDLEGRPEGWEDDGGYFVGRDGNAPRPSSSEGAPRWRRWLSSIFRQKD